MKYLIIFSVLFVAYFVKTFPPLEKSRATGAIVAQIILAAVIGFCIGFGWSQSLTDVLLK